jgi:hypothetical protein
MDSSSSGGQDLVIRASSALATMIMVISKYRLTIGSRSDVATGTIHGSPVREAATQTAVPGLLCSHAELSQG